jgi:hypothetical protein
VSSLPLSLTTFFGFAARAGEPISSQATCRPENELSAATARHCRVRPEHENTH